MKTISILGFLLAGSILNAQPASQGAAGNSTLPVSTPYTAVSRDANSTVWQRQTYDPAPDGAVVTNTHQYVELASGLNYWNGTRYVPSAEKIVISADGSSAMATNGQHQVYFPGNIYNGQIKLVTPDGKILKSQPVGLAYSDGSNSVLLAVVTNATGAILPSGNQVIYTNAFEGLNADLLYTYTKAGFEQDVVLREQPPDPGALGLNPQTARIQVLTEFFNPPQPSVSARMSPTAAGNLEDDTLSFGKMKMVRGRAFSIGNRSRSNSRFGGTPTYKRWLRIQGRTFLVEDVPIVSIATNIDTLPPYVGQAGVGTKPVVSKNLVLPPPRLVRTSPKSMFLAQVQSPKQGLVLDYVTLNSGLGDYIFQGDTTYYVSGFLSVDGNATFEGGTVLKFASGAGLEFNGNITCNTGPYRPAILTAVDDNSVGDTISGSSGSPSGYYALIPICINNTNVLTLQNLRIEYASYGIAIDVWSGPLLTVQDCQFLNTGMAISFGWQLNVDNTLFWNVGTAIQSSSPNAINITAHNVNTFNSYGTLYATNSLFVCVTNLGTISGAYNATNSSDSGVFQTAGAGSHYLATNSIYRGQGTTNIDPTVLADIQTKTTYPPTIYSNVTVSVNTTLDPQAQRDTDAPDLGYHYDPIDYLVDQFWVTNAVLTVTNGAVIACYNDSGILITDGSSINSVGTPIAPNWFVRYQSAQEQSISLAMYTNNPPSLGDAVNSWHSSNAPNGYFRFTKFACPSGGGGHLYDEQDNWIFTNLWVQDCEFWGGTSVYGGGTNTVATLINNLFVRSTLTTTVIQGSYFYLTNNLFWGASRVQIAPRGNTNWGAYNNAFDSCGTIQSGIGGLTNNGYNAFLNCTNYLQPTNSTDLFSTNTLAYQTSWFGTFYQPSSSPLINAGSTTADQVGLYHFTTQTNQVPETNSTVDIGYHYVATDQYGNPLDSNGNGIPDYIEDTNGNGQPLTISLLAPTNNSYFKEPATVPMQAMVFDWSGTVTNVEFYHESIGIVGVTTSPYSYNWPIVAAGSYTVMAEAYDDKGATAFSTPLVTVTVTNLCGN